MTPDTLSPEALDSLSALVREMTQGEWRTEENDDPRWGLRLRGPESRDHDNSLDSLEPGDARGIEALRNAADRLILAARRAHEMEVALRDLRDLMKSEDVSIRTRNFVDLPFGSVTARIDALLDGPGVLAKGEA